MSFWVYVVSVKGIVAAADTRLTYSNTTGHSATHTDNVTKILNVSNNHSGAAILITGYKFWDDNFEASVKEHLNKNPEHSAKDLIDYLAENVNFKGNCFIGIVCSNVQTNKITCLNLQVDYDPQTKKSTLTSIQARSENSFDYADSANYLMEKPSFLESLTFLPYGESFIDRAKAVVDSTVKAYSRSRTAHASTVSDTPEIMTIIGKKLTLQTVMKDNTPFHPNPFNQQPTSNVNSGVPPQHIDMDSALRGLPTNNNNPY